MICDQQAGISKVTFDKWNYGLCLRAADDCPHLGLLMGHAYQENKGGGVVEVLRNSLAVKLQEKSLFSKC